MNRRRRNGLLGCIVNAGNPANQWNILCGRYTNDLCRRPGQCEIDRDVGGTKQSRKFRIRGSRPCAANLAAGRRIYCVHNLLTHAARTQYRNLQVRVRHRVTG
jgi:hypothetical protein